MVPLCQPTAEVASDSLVVVPNALCDASATPNPAAGGDVENSWRPPYDRTYMPCRAYRSVKIRALPGLSKRNLSCAGPGRDKRFVGHSFPLQQRGLSNLRLCRTFGGNGLC